MSFPALPLTPSCQRAAPSAFILFCFLFLIFFFFSHLFSPVLPCFHLLWFCLPCLHLLPGFQSPYLHVFPTSMSPTRLLGRSVLPTPWPGQCAAGCPGRAPDCSCSPCPSYQSFFSVTSRVHIEDGWKKQTITGEAQISHCSSSLIPSGKHMHIWVSRKCNEELGHTQ